MTDHDQPDTDLTDPHGEAEALRREIARLWAALAEATDPDFIWGAMDNVHDADTTLDDYAAAVSRAQRAALAASQSHDPVVNAGSCQRAAKISGIGASGRFKKKPVVIEAIQWTGENLREVLAFTGKHPSWVLWFQNFAEYAAYVAADRQVFKIKTLEGTMEAMPGDWIIRGVKGECYPCKPDIFVATYEAAE